MREVRTHWNKKSTSTPAGRLWQTAHYITGSCLRKLLRISVYCIIYAFELELRRVEYAEYEHESIEITAE